MVCDGSDGRSTWGFTRENGWLPDFFPECDSVSGSWLKLILGSHPSRAMTVLVLGSKEVAGIFSAPRAGSLEARITALSVLVVMFCLPSCLPTACRVSAEKLAQESILAAS